MTVDVFNMTVTEIICLLNEANINTKPKIKKFLKELGLVDGVDFVYNYNFILCGLYIKKEKGYTRTTLVLDSYYKNYVSRFNYLTPNGYRKRLERIKIHRTQDKHFDASIFEMDRYLFNTSNKENNYYASIKMKNIITYKSLKQRIEYLDRNMNENNLKILKLKEENYERSLQKDDLRRSIQRLFISKQTENKKS